MPLTWPPSLDDLKSDANITVDRDDARLQMVLDEAIAYVREIHDGRYDFDGAGVFPPVPGSFPLGAIRLALRENARRRSPDALMGAGDASARIPSFDADIERLLKIGRRMRAVIG